MSTPNQNPIEPIPAQDSTERNSDVSQNKGNPPSGAIAKPQPPPPNGENHNSTKRLRKIASFRKAGIFWMEIGTFIALIAYATITKNQWETARQATNAAFIAASAAQSQIAKMEESNAINRESLETVQRAFVNFSDAPHLEPIYQPSGDLFLVDIGIDNSGATQAHALKDRTSWIAPVGYLPNNYTFPDIAGKLQTPWAATGANVIPAKSSIKTQAVFIPAKFFVEFLQQHSGAGEQVRPGVPVKATRNIFLYGWAIYRDVFKETPTHLTEFCRVLAFFKVQGQNATDAWQHCPWHNCTDDDCPDYKERLGEAEAAPTFFSRKK